MKMISALKYKILLSRIESCLNEISPWSHHWTWLTSSKDLINHCMADGLTPEESILYIALREYERLNGPEDFFKGCDYSFCLYEDNYGRNKNANQWFTLAKKYRDGGRVRSRIFNDFLTTMNQIKKKIPQLFSGESPELRYFWRVHFETNVPYTFGYDYNDYNDFDVESLSTEVASFELFSDAAKYVEENCSVDLWWHTCNLRSIPENDIPEWEKTPTPKEFCRINEKHHIGYPFDCHQGRLAGDCIIAMPQSTYDSWMEAVKSNDRDKEISLLPSCFHWEGDILLGMEYLDHLLTIPLHHSKSWVLTRDFYYLIEGENSSYIKQEVGQFHIGYDYNDFDGDIPI